jgi:CheY-like chemotaxis protein
MGKTILLADDSVTIRRIVELTFSETDYRVESVGSGSEALERLAELRPDVVVADVAMPGPDGYEVCREVKLSARPVPVVLLVGTFERFDEEAARECAADGHLTKPFDSASLVYKIESVLAGPPARIARDEPAAEEAGPPVPDPDVVEETVPGEVRGEQFRMSDPPQDIGGAAPSTSGVAGAARPDPSEAPVTLAPEQLEWVVREVLGRMSTDAVRELARELVPEIAERVVRERIREIEGEEP